MKDNTTERTVTNFDKTNGIAILRDQFFDFIRDKKENRWQYFKVDAILFKLF